MRSYSLLVLLQLVWEHPNMEGKRIISGKWEKEEGEKKCKGGSNANKITIRRKISEMRSNYCNGVIIERLPYLSYPCSLQILLSWYSVSQGETYSS